MPHECARASWSWQCAVLYIIVDAVDESPIKLEFPLREKVLQLINELVDLWHLDLHVCITTRPKVDIQSH
jgi:hypothetical protein